MKESIENAKSISNIFNDYMSDPRAIAVYLATKEHRYLQDKEFKMMLDFIALKARDYKAGRYDARNELACQMSKVMFDAITENWTKEHIDFLYESLDRTIREMSL